MLCHYDRSRPEEVESAKKPAIHPITRSGRKRVGAAAVEFAVLLPLIFFIFLAAVDFARVLYVVVIVDNCVDNGAMYGSQIFDNANQQWISSDAQYWQGPNNQVISTEQAATFVDGGNVKPALTSSNINAGNGTDADGNPVNIVTVTYTFKPIGAYWGIPNQFTFSRTCQMRIAPATPSH
jgi:Flp pilus assembly protein TadG